MPDAICVLKAAVGSGGLDVERSHRQDAECGAQRFRHGLDLGHALEKGGEVVQGVDGFG